MTKISIITTFYNPGKDIIDCVRSVSEQSFRDYEHILVNDGSSDSSVEKVNKLGLSKIKLLSPGRIGRVAALNYGISIASGDYVSILDADDIFLRDKLKIQNELLDNDKSISLVYSNVIFVNKYGKKIGKSDYPTSHNEIFEYLKNLNPFPASSAMFRKSKFIDVNGYNDKCEKSIDFNLYLSLIIAGGKFKGITKPLNLIKINENSWGKSDNQSLQIKFGMLGLFNYYFVKNNKKSLFEKSSNEWQELLKKFNLWFEKNNFNNKQLSKKYLHKSIEKFRERKIFDGIYLLIKSIRKDKTTFFHKGIGFYFERDAEDFEKYINS